MKDTETMLLDRNQRIRETTDSELMDNEELLHIYIAPTIMHYMNILLHMRYS
jgi:hypothetical protein